MSTAFFQILSILKSVVFIIEQILLRNGFLSTIPPTLKMVLQKMLPFELDEVNPRVLFPRVLPNLVTDICIFALLFLALKFRSVHIILMRTCAFSTIIYFSSLYERGALDNASMLVRMFIYITVALAFIIIVVNAQIYFPFSILK